jgi:hypothetical protein
MFIHKKFILIPLLGLDFKIMTFKKISIIFLEIELVLKMYSVLRSKN